MITGQNNTSPRTRIVVDHATIIMVIINILIVLVFIIKDVRKMRCVTVSVQFEFHQMI